MAIILVSVGLAQIGRERGGILNRIGMVLQYVLERDKEEEI